MSAPTAKPKIRTKRQNEMLMLVEQGLSNEQMAKALDLSPSTIKGTLNRIFKILGVNRRSAAVKAWKADVKSKDMALEMLRKSRRKNEANIQALQELVKLQTEAIELMLQQR